MICQIFDLVKANYICLERNKGSKTPFCKKKMLKSQPVCSVQPCCHVFGQLPSGENDICSVSICCEGYIMRVI